MAIVPNRNAWSLRRRGARGWPFARRPHQTGVLVIVSSSASERARWVRAQLKAPRR